MTHQSKVLATIIKNKHVTSFIPHNDETAKHFRSFLNSMCNSFIEYSKVFRAVQFCIIEFHKKDHK